MNNHANRQGRLGWVLQRFTAALLLFYLGIHLWALHIAEGGRKIDFQAVALRLHNPFFQIVDIVLIAVVVYHGLYGLRGILFDLVVRSGARSAITWGFVLLGLATFLLAIRAYMAFLGA